MNNHLDVIDVSVLVAIMLLGLVALPRLWPRMVAAEITRAVTVQNEGRRRCRIAVTQ